LNFPIDLHKQSSIKIMPGHKNVQHLISKRVRNEAIQFLVQWSDDSAPEWVDSIALLKYSGFKQALRELEGQQTLGEARVNNCIVQDAKQ
jgi:hypothetical protein